MLSPGEYVIRAASAQRLGYGALEHMNKEGIVPGFAEGGKTKRFKITDYGFAEPVFDEEIEKAIAAMERAEKEKNGIGKTKEKKKGALKSIFENIKRRKEYEKALGFADGGAPGSYITRFDPTISKNFRGIYEEKRKELEEKIAIEGPSDPREFIPNWAKSSPNLYAAMMTGMEMSGVMGMLSPDENERFLTALGITGGVAVGPLVGKAIKGASKIPGLGTDIKSLFKFMSKPLKTELHSSVSNMAVRTNKIPGSGPKFDAWLSKQSKQYPEKPLPYPGSPEDIARLVNEVMEHATTLRNFPKTKVMRGSIKRTLTKAKWPTNASWEMKNMLTQMDETAEIFSKTSFSPWKSGPDMPGFSLRDLGSVNFESMSKVLTEHSLAGLRSTKSIPEKSKYFKLLKRAAKQRIHESQGVLGTLRTMNLEKEIQRRMYFSEKIFSKPKLTAKKQNLAGQQKQLSALESNEDFFKYLMTHETAHLVHEPGSPIYTKYLEKVKSRYGEDITKYKYGEAAPSKYATTNWEEFKAESLASAIHTPRGKATESIKYLKDLMGIELADGGAVETLRAIGMSEEDIKRELGGIKEPLFGPGDIIGVGGGLTKLLLGLGKGAVKYALKKPKTYEELLKPGTKDVINFIKNRLAEPGDLVAESKAARDVLRSGRGDFLRRQGLLPSKKLSNPKKKQNKMMKELGFAGGGIVGYQAGGLQKKRKRSGRFDDMIVEASKKYNISAKLIKAIIRQESGFKPNIVSKKGAMGLMQLMPGTAKDLGVENAFDPLQNIMGGTEYFRKMLDRFGGDIQLALAAYNAGPGAVDKYGGIPPYKETKGYVSTICKTGVCGLEEVKPKEMVAVVSTDPWKEAQKRRKEEAIMLKEREKSLIVSEETFLPPEMARRAMEGAREQERTGKVRSFYGGFGEMEELSKGAAALYGMPIVEERKPRDLKKEAEWEARMLAELEEKKKKRFERTGGESYFVAGPGEYSLKEMEKTKEEFVKHIGDKDRWKSMQENMDAIKRVMPAQPKKGVFPGKPVDVEQIEWAKGLGPFLPGSRTLEEVNKMVAERAKEEAARRLSEARADKFKVTPGKTIKAETIGITTDVEAVEMERMCAKAGDVEYLAAMDYEAGIDKTKAISLYDVPATGWKKAGEVGKLMGMAGGEAEGKRFHFLKQTKERLEKMLVEVDDVTVKLYSDAGKEKEEQVRYMLEDQIKRTNELIDYMQSGGNYGEREWSDKLGRYYSPRLHEFNILEKDYNRDSRGLFRSWDRAKVAEGYKDVFGEENYLDVQKRKGFFVQDHMKVQKFVEAGDIEKAKEVWKEVKEREKRVSETVSERLKARSEKYPGVRSGRIPYYDLGQETKPKVTGTSKLSELSDVEQLEVRTALEIKKARDAFNRGDLDTLKELVKDLTPEQLKHFKSMGVMHTGGRVRKTGPVFLQKGEMVYPQGFKYGGVAHNDIYNQPADSNFANNMVSDSLNSQTIKVDVSELKAVVSRLESVEIQVPKLEVNTDGLPKLEVDISNVDLKVDGSEAAAKIAGAVENININVNTEGSVGAEELKNISDALENRINSVNVAVEDLQNEMSVITSGEPLDIDNIISGKIAELTSNFDQKINDINASVSSLQSATTQSKRMVELAANEMDNKIKSLQNFSVK
jgi:hypothetical protein